MQGKAKWVDKAVSWGAVALAALTGAAVLYYLLLPARGTFFADTTDTLYWAQASYDSGRLVDPDFYYATLLPFGGSLLMLPFFPFFGMSMTTHLAGMALFAVCFMAALWFLISGLPTGRTGGCLMFSATLLVLCASGKLREIMWEHVIYYSLGLLFTFLMLGVMFRLLFRPAGAKPAAEGEKAGARQMVLLALLLVLGVLAGLDGPQVSIFCGLPVALAVVAERFFNPDGPLKMRESRPAFIAAGVLLAGTLAGLLITRLAWGGVETAYSDSYLVFSAPGSWGEHLLGIGESWATLLGFSAQGGESLVSLRALVELARLAAAGLLFILPLAAAFGYSHIQSRRLRILLWYHWILTLVTLGSHIFGRTYDANWRMTPMAASAAIVTAALLHHGWMRGGHQRVLRRAVRLGMAALALFCAINLAGMLRIAPSAGLDGKLYQVAQTLEQHGLSQGFSGFETAHSVTVITGERVKVRLVDITEEGVTPRLYQTRQSWYGEESADGRYFLITAPEHLAQLEQSEHWQQLAKHQLETIPCGEFLIVVYDQNIVSGI